MPPVLPVDVLDHFLAPLVLEIDVDVRRLVAFLADETLEEETVKVRIDLRHAEAIADHGVRGAAPALAQDALGARPAHDIGDREEVGLVGELRDQCEFVLDHAPDA